MKETMNGQAAVGAGLIAVAEISEQIQAPRFTYHVECLDKDGKLKWADDFMNVVCTGGKNDLLDKYFAGSSYTAAWYFGLIDSDGYTTGPAAGDTMSSHGGWAESTEYSNANRVTISFAAASGGSKATALASAFNINATTTIKGAFVTSNNTKGGTSGILYSAGLFSGGDRSVISGDTLNVSGSWAV
jgi:hypothetical protein